MFSFGLCVRSRNNTTGRLIILLWWLWRTYMYMVHSIYSISARCNSTYAVWIPPFACASPPANPITVGPWSLLPRAHVAHFAQRTAVRSWRQLERHNVHAWHTHTNTVACAASVRPGAHLAEPVYVWRVRAQSRTQINANRGQQQQRKALTRAGAQRAPHAINVCNVCAEWTTRSWNTRRFWKVIRTRAHNARAFAQSACRLKSHLVLLVCTFIVWYIRPYTQWFSIDEV